MNTDVHGAFDLREETRGIIGAAFEVANQLGPGFLERVYERAMLVELAERGIPAEAQKPLSVQYKGHCVGEYMADILVAKSVVVELKCVQTLRNEHMAQCMNYLRATGLRLCLLINFQHARLEWKRVAL